MVERDLAGRPVHAVLEQMASARAEPAAGSAAALTAALAAALAGKVARLSRRQLEDAEKLAEQADTLRRRALELAESDARAVADMVAALQLAAQDEPRRRVPRASASEAVAVPAAIGEVATEIDRLAARLGANGNPRLHADAEAARHLAQGAARTARDIVRANEEPPA